MFTIFLLFLPCSVCLFLLASLLTGGLRLGTNKLLALLYLLGVLYFYVDACWVCPILNTTIPFYVLEMIGKSAGLTIIPLFYIWVRRSWNDNPVNPVFYILFILPVLLLGSQLTIFCLMGFDNAEVFLHRMFVNPSLDNVKGEGFSLILGQTYIKVCYLAYIIIQGLEALLMLVLIVINLIKHIRNKEWSRTARELMLSDISCLVIMLVIIVRMHLGVTFLTDHWNISSAFCVVLCVGLFVIGNSANKLRIMEAWMVPDDGEADNSTAAEALELKESFEKLMSAENKIFLNRGLTIEGVSHMLHTNRTYLGRMLKECYGCSFKDYVSRKRLSFVKEYMLAHPQEKLDFVAEAAGFADSSHLTKRFHDYEGCTPRQWLESQLSK